MPKRGDNGMHKYDNHEMVDDGHQALVEYGDQSGGTTDNLTTSTATVRPSMATAAEIASE
ncbi:hypothetical protein PR003_g32550 [Phytophthora rubi]|uniref:Uncharacterized protein n=1 Tax=Phytophthora rubi TaxID=129364 RepID=A0A6A4AWJ2_9STRA|nr:hypothetical protein PR002_g31382 [Phytophthora rubi]KAE8957649.1 hypothetical protein PR001_g31297 [Phytophthora rubi]KAE9265135.1 hypothetical protein PR003_g32550 [Phytophthora rubi]